MDRYIITYVIKSVKTAEAWRWLKERSWPAGIIHIL